MPIKVRIVKGANLAMERIEAAVHGWPQAPYETKAEVDANYTRMVEYGCRPEPAEAVRLGIARHKLFDIAYGLVLREAHGVEPWVEFEMLEGLYAPVVRAEDFHSAIAYLVRRLDENTAPENFLRHVFDLASLVPPRADGLAGAAPLRIIGSGGGGSARAAIFTVIYGSP